MVIKRVFHLLSLLPLWLKISLIILFVIIIGVVISLQTSNKQTGYIFDTAKKTALTEIVSDSGEIISDGKIEVNSPTNGIVTEVFVKNGQTVKEDEQLLSIKSSATVQEQQTAYANYVTAVAQQNTAETLLHTYRSTMYTNWQTYMDLATSSQYESDHAPKATERTSSEFQIAQEDWLATEKQYIDQQQAVAAAQAQVNAAWTAYQATQTAIVTAPISGIVTNLDVSVGNSVTIPTALHPNATPFLTIVNSPKVEAILYIGQTAIAKVKKGQQVKIHPDPYKDKEYDGTVIQVATLGQDMQGIITYKVTLGFTKSDDLLRPGMTIDGDIITQQLSNVLTVPNTAIVLYKGGKTVRVVKDKNLVYIPIKVGIVGEERTQILSGITKGQQIVVALTNEKAARPGFLGL